MEIYSFLTFMGGVLVGLGIGMFMAALVLVVWSWYGDT